MTLYAWIALAVSLLTVAATAFASERAAVRRGTSRDRRKEREVAETVIDWFAGATFVCCLALIVIGKPLSVIVYVFVAWFVLCWLGIVVAVNVTRRAARK